MNLENQVTSLETSERLKELGVKQESYFYWINWPSGWGLDDQLRHNEHDFIPAFTVAELGEMLPENKQLTSKDGNKWSMVWGENLQEGYGVFEDTEAEARAKMLIYLLEKKND